jgi:peptidyl-prolyl cis-trans isomerase C
MRANARSGLLALSAVTAALLRMTPAVAQAQAPATTNPPAANAPAPRPDPAVMKQVVATVNGVPITRGDLVAFLSNYSIPAGNEEQVYRDAINSIANNRLIALYLDRQRVPVSEEKVDEEVAKMEANLKQNGTDLATEIRRTNKSMAEIRKSIADQLRWVNFVKDKARDAELKKFFETHRDLFSGTQVRASQIFLKVDPKASAEEKEKVRQKLLGIKRDIEMNKISFAEAANKYSEDPANEGGAGGDVGYFTLRSGFIEEFANAAFALKKGSYSDPVETPYGFHLIQATDRKEGGPVDFERDKPQIHMLYAVELQKNILSAELKHAKIDIKPMPPDLFLPATPAPANAPTGAAPKGAAAPK